MTFIKDSSRELQQVYLHFFQNLVRQKPATFDWIWSDDENNEQTQQSKNTFQPASKKASSNISLGKPKNPTSPQKPDSLLFTVTQFGQFVDSIELNKDGVKSQKSTASSDKLLAQIEILQSLPEGTIIPSAPSIQVQSVEKRGDKILSTEVLLSTDSQGKITKNTLSPSPQQTGTKVINDQLSLIHDKALAQYLDNLIKTCVKDRVLAAASHLQSQRQQQPSNVKWWQQLLQTGGQLLSHFTKEHQHKQVAKKLYYLFSKNVQFGDNRFSQNGYTILRQPKGEKYRYTVLNSNDQPILTFDVNQQKRLSIVNNQLSVDDSKALANLGKSNINLHPQPTPTNPALMTRANQVAASLVQMAQQQKRSIRRVGHSYTLAISPNGDVEISAPGRGVIYHQTLHNHKPIATNLMTEADLAFFESQFSSSQQQQQSNPSPVSTVVSTRSRRR